MFNASARISLATVILLSIACTSLDYSGLKEYDRAPDTTNNIGESKDTGSAISKSMPHRSTDAHLPMGAVSAQAAATHGYKASFLKAPTHGDGGTVDDDSFVIDPLSSLLRGFNISQDGSITTVGSLEVDVGNCPNEWRDDGPEVVLFRDDWLAREWGTALSVEPSSFGAYAYFEQRLQTRSSEEQVPMLFSETLWSQEDTGQQDVASESAIARASLAIERSQAPTGTHMLALSAADRCLPVIATDLMPYAGVPASVWNLPSPLNEHQGMYAHFSAIADDLADAGMKRVGAFVTRPVCCHGTQDAEADLALVSLEPDPDLQEQFRPSLSEMEEQHGEFLIYSAPEDPRVIEELLAQAPDAVVLGGACEVVAVRLRDAGFEGPIAYAYPTCSLLETGLSDYPIRLDPMPDCRLCGHLRDSGSRSPDEQLAEWLAALRPGDLIVAPFPVPGVDDSAATREALEHMAGLDRVAWHHGLGAEAQRRLDGWILGWYADTLLDAAEEIEHRFLGLDLPLRLRVLIAAWHLETPHPLFDTTVRTEIGDPRFTRDLWWYTIDKTALIDGEQFLKPLPRGRGR